MRIIVVLWILMVFFVTASLLSPIGMKMDEKARRLRSTVPGRKNFMEEELHRPFTERFVKPLIRKLTERTSVFGTLKKNGGRGGEKLAMRLKAAGIGLTAQEYGALKLTAQLTVVAGASAAALFIEAKPAVRLLIAAAGAVTATLAPELLLREKTKKRQAAILDELPEVMDLLLVSVQAGLGFDNAITQLYKKRCTVLLKELMQPVRDVQLGLSRREALKDMGERNGVQELKTFATALIQAEQLGVSIRTVLSTQSEQLRIARRQRIEAKTAKAPVKMMIPTVVFIFPVMFIILLAPAAMQIVKVF